MVLGVYPAQGKTAMFEIGFLPLFWGGTHFVAMAVLQQKMPFGCCHAEQALSALLNVDPVGFRDPPPSIFSLSWYGIQSSSLYAVHKHSWSATRLA